MKGKSQAVLVVGGGVAGIQASLDLANLGHKVNLIEKSPSLGGLTSQLYRTYPVCFCCKIPPLIAEVERHPNIKVYTSSKLTDLKGDQGDFEAIVRRFPSGEKEEELSIDVGSLVLSTGFEMLDARLIETYGYGELPNVLTSLEFERLLSLFGPSKGILRRPSDGEVPKKIAWLQCVGSREIRRAHVGYCSGVCCMHAVKEALNAKEKADGEIDTSVFYIDLRAFGRHFEDYVKKAEDAGVRFVRARIGELKQAEGGHDILVTYVNEEGKRIYEIFNMVILSVGLKPSQDVVDLAKTLRLNLNHYDFVETHTFSPTKTSRPGIYVCGALEEPKDIYGALVQASAGAAEIACELGSVQQECDSKMPLRDVSDELVRVVVFIGKGIEEHVDTEALKIYAESLGGVAHVGILDVTGCREDEKPVIDAIKAGESNRIVFAGCSGRNTETFYFDLVREAGLSPYLAEQVNLHELCSFVHEGRRDDATEKAKDLVRIAVAKVVNAQPLNPYFTEVKKSTLIIGGGLSGMVAADNITRMGFDAHIVEKGELLWGIARHIKHTINGDDVGTYLRGLQERLSENPLVHIHTKAELLELCGQVGDFTSRVRVDGEEKIISHGAVIVATGGKELRPEEYLYGLDSRVLTALEFEERIPQILNPFTEIKNVVMIQCVGSREPHRPYCSRICCTKAVGNAIELKKKRPDVNVYVLYRDLRTYGFKEDLYREARERGVVFIRFDLSQKPEVQTRRTEEMDILEVRVADKLLGEPVTIEADLIVLAAAVIAPQGSERLAEILGVPLDNDGFFKLSPKKLKPVETDRAGIFVCGLANGPKFIEESIAETQAATVKAAHILRRPYLELWPINSMVDVNNCDGCGYCIDPCPYKALNLFEYMYEGQVKKIADVNEALCQGCGVCQGTCPKKGIAIRNYVPDQLEAMVEAALAV
jgi:heterodisulfide reductase subunit A